LLKIQRRLVQSFVVYVSRQDLKYSIFAKQLKLFNVCESKNLKLK
jgi:hypothetical protein